MYGAGYCALGLFYQGILIQYIQIHSYYNQGTSIT